MKHTTQSLPIALAVSLIACASATQGPAKPTTPPPTEPASPDPSEAADAAPLPTGPVKVRTNLHLLAPLMSPHFEATPVAAIEDEVITVRELLAGLSSPAGHENAKVEPEHEHDQRDQSKDTYDSVLDRLINTRLMLVEATTMGLDEKPEITAALDDFETKLLRTLVRERALANVEADPAEADQIYKESALRWRIRSALFEKEADAKALHAEVASGSTFADVADRLIEQGRTRGTKETEEVDPSNLLPAIRAAVQELAPGQTSPVVNVPQGYVVVFLEAVTYVDDPVAKARARAMSLQTQRDKALRAHYNTLVEKYARINERRLSRLDFEARRPGFERLAKSSKVLVEIEGAPPVTVADLAAALRKDFFHGVGPAARDKRLNDKKSPALAKILAKRLLLKEAIDTRQRETDEFRNKMQDKRVELIVGLFIRTVVVPEVKLSKEEVEAHYQTHLDDFLLPEFVRIESMGFTTAEAAAEAAEALREGNEWDWLLANADDLADEPRRSLPNSNRPLTTEGMPEELATALEGATAGTVTLYAPTNNLHYVVRLVQRIPARPLPFEDVRKQLAADLFAERVDLAVQDWSRRLRNVYEVRRYLQSIETTLAPASEDSVRPSSTPDETASARTPRPE